jgi:hypothetical protein
MREINKTIQVIIDSLSVDRFYTGKIKTGSGAGSARINVNKKFVDCRYILVILEDKDVSDKTIHLKEVEADVQQ